MASTVGDVDADSVITYVFNYLEATSLARSAAVSRRWLTLARADEYWKPLLVAGFQVNAMEDPPRCRFQDQSAEVHQVQSESFCATYARWVHATKGYGSALDIALYKRSAAVWGSIESFMASELPAVLPTVRAAQVFEAVFEAFHALHFS